jgi:hypothetical protein
VRALVLRTPLPPRPSSSGDPFGGAGAGAGVASDSSLASAPSEADLAGLAALKMPADANLDDCERGARKASVHAVSAFRVNVDAL